MSLKTKFSSILTIAIGIVVFSTFTFAQESKTTTKPEKAEKLKKAEGREFGKRKMGREGFAGRHGGREMFRGRLMHGLHSLNLTDAQKGQIKAILQANKPDRGNIDEIRTIRQSRRAGNPITDEQKAQMKAIREQAQAKAKSVREQILGVLTAEQKAQLEKRKLEMKQHRQEHMQKKAKDPAAPKTEKPRIS